MKHKGTVTIETDRLILRRFTADDADAAFGNWHSDNKVTEFLRWPTHNNIGVTKRVLGGWIAGYEKLDFYQWAIVPKDINEPIGATRVLWTPVCTAYLHLIILKNRNGNGGGTLRHSLSFLRYLSSRKYGSPKLAGG